MGDVGHDAATDHFANRDTGHAAAMDHFANRDTGHAAPMNHFANRDPGHAAAMDLFLNAGFVRLRSRGRNKYLHAHEDAVGVTLRPLGAVPSLNAVWKVNLWPVQGGNVILLQGAAYGRYLAVALDGEYVPPGYRGVRALQLNYTSMELDGSFAWRAVRVEAGQNYVRLQNNQGNLRANGRHRHWNNRVTVDARNADDTTMMQWMVEAIPSTPEPLPLPPPPQPPIPVRRGLFRRRTGHNVHQQLGRRIRYLRMDDNGNFVNEEDWPEFFFVGNSVTNLRTQVARHVNDENITLGVRAGINALIIPLVTNLPDNEYLMEIIVYTTGSPGAAQLRYPQF